MYRPLYWFGHDGPGLQQQPQPGCGAGVLRHDRVVTVTMKNFKWSNGAAVNAGTWSSG